MHNTQTGLVSPFQGSNAQFYNFTDTTLLVVFQPNRSHQLGISANRPFLYNFNDRFVNAAMEVVDQGQRAGGPNYLGMVEGVLGSSEGRASLVPVSQPDSFTNMNVLNDNWRFMLILNRPKAPDLGTVSMFSNLVKHRVICTGYFLDEPVSPFTQAINPNATMVFTHKTVFEVMEAMTPAGSVTKSLNTRYDANFVNHFNTTMMNDPTQFYIDPTACYDGTYDDMGGSTFAAPGVRQRVGWNETNRALDAKFSNPETNMRHLIGNIISSKREVTDRPHLGSMYTDAHISLPHQQMETFHDVLSRNLHGSGSSAALLGPNESDVLTLGVLDAQYSPMQVQVAYSDQTGSFMTMDQSMLSPNNVFCSLIAAAAPTIMSSAAMARVDFKFTSYYDRKDPLHRYGLEIYNTIPSMPMGPQLMVERTNAVIAQLDRSVFQSLYESRGDFTLNASIDMGGLTQLWLHFFCDTQRYAEPYQHPTMYGGLNTPLIGTAMASSHNTSQVASFVDQMSHSGLVESRPDMNFSTDGTSWNAGPAPAGMGSNSGKFPELEI